MPLISILMAANRAEKTILAAINSIRGQQHRNWDLIIANDCGADYLALCRANGIDDRRIRMVATPAIGSGPSVARNCALAVARGDYLSILDSDDTWQPAKLSALLPLAKQSGLACDNTCAMYPDGRVIATAYPISAMPRDIDAVTMMNTGVPHFPLLRRDLAGTGYQPDLRFAEDVVFNMEAIARAGAMTLLPQSLTHYIQRADSATNAVGSWQRAEAAYGQILEMLQNRHLAVPARQERTIKRAFAQKRRLNLAYGAAIEAGETSTFQDFLASRRLHGEYGYDVP
ncbi:MAG: glycosyltransferase [Proteobacteria bacterium]|nr:glycosyltransferase [Pseudomonadota bacterium]